MPLSVNRLLFVAPGVKSKASPSWMTAPEPLMAAGKSTPWTKLVLRLKAMAPEPTTSIGLLRLMEPVAPPLPSCRMPSVTSVLPE